jgi:hypothetical protein
MASLIATGQVGTSERIYVDIDATRRGLVFSKDFADAAAETPEPASGKSAAA